MPPIRNTPIANWHRPLASPIRLRHGHVIETLAQAAGLMTQRLPKQRQLKPIWQRAAALLMEAHASGCPEDLQRGSFGARSMRRVGRLNREAGVAPAFASRTRGRGYWYKDPGSRRDLSPRQLHTRRIRYRGLSKLNTLADSFA